jgi:hypothetical protein
MKTRHKIPSVFSIYMVDVLCCALGCVILLWQLYHQESQEQTAQNEIARKEIARKEKENEIAHKENEEARLRLEAAKLALGSLTSEVESLKVSLDANAKKQLQITLELEDTRKDRDKAQALALVRKKEYDEAKKTLVSAEAIINLLRLDLKKQEQKATLTAAELADKIRAHAELFDKLAEAEKKIRALTADVARRDTDAQLVSRTVQEKTSLVKLLEDELTLLRSQNKETMAKLSAADMRSRVLEDDLQRGRKELLDINRRFTDLTQSQDGLLNRMMVNAKDLESAKLALAALERDKASLIKKTAAAEARFAGITLTGKRVIFLVDMSGSMEMVDETTFDPDKWPIVCDTVARIMQSLTDLRQYQVIIFSDRFKYAFGNEGRWLDYSPETSPRKVAEGLKAIKPKGGTDMYTALEEVFRFRNAGLDTVYLFSDGLPNVGEGLPANANRLTETQRGELLGKYIRTKLKTNWNRPATNQARVRINCIGFFFESPDLGAFLWALARENDGSFVGMSRP